MLNVMKAERRADARERGGCNPRLMSDDDRVTSDVEWLVVERLRLELTLTDGGACTRPHGAR